MNILARAEARRALRSASRPKLAELTAELLSGGGPVVDDILAQVLDVALEINLVLLEPADVEFLARSATTELASKVLFVVTDDP